MNAHPKLSDYINSDCYRYSRKQGVREVVRLLRTSPGFRFTFVFRIASAMRNSSNPIAMLTRIAHRHYSVKYGIQIPISAVIGPGLLLPHFGGIVINSNAKIGSNCTILHGVTIGSVLAGKMAGCPSLNDSVYLGPGSAVVGNVSLGSGAMISANAWVNFDVPEDALVIGNPGRIVKIYPDGRDLRTTNGSPALR